MSCAPLPKNIRSGGCSISTNFSTTKELDFNNAGLGYADSASIPVMADFEGNGHSDFSVFQPDGMGGASFVFQDVEVSHGVVYDFATPANLPVGIDSETVAEDPVRKSNANWALGGGSRPLAGPGGNSGGGIRTPDTRIMIPLL